jgi:hypothetical protein
LVTNTFQSWELQFDDAMVSPELLGIGAQTAWYAPAVIGKLGEVVNPVT